MYINEQEQEHRERFLERLAQRANRGMSIGPFSLDYELATGGFVWYIGDDGDTFLMVWATPYVSTRVRYRSITVDVQRRDGGATQRLPLVEFDGTVAGYLRKMRGILRSDLVREALRRADLRAGDSH